MKIRDLRPLFLGILLIALICVFSIARYKNQMLWQGSLINYDIVLAFVYIIWILFESRITKNEIAKGSKTADRGTCEPYALGQGGVIVSALWCDPVWEVPNVFHSLGFLMFVVGIVFRGWAILTLGKYYSHIVREVENHIIIDVGPYRHIRHPAYSGMILANIGIALFFLNPVTIAIFVLLLLPAIILRIVSEERTLFKIKGYAEFAESRKRIVPPIW